MQLRIFFVRQWSIDYEARVCGGARRAAMNNGARNDGRGKDGVRKFRAFLPVTGRALIHAAVNLRCRGKAISVAPGACCCVGGPDRMFWQLPGNPFDYSFVRVAIACTGQRRNQSRPRKPAGFMPNPPDSPPSISDTPPVTSRSCEFRSGALLRERTSLIRVGVSKCTVWAEWEIKRNLNCNPILACINPLSLEKHWYWIFLVFFHYHTYVIVLL